ncbi:MAG: hypothetical protein HY262_00830 [Chloroflexi bacterium]|nr:hypothetical protein [Chloroflexota bacterium]
MHERRPPAGVVGVTRDRWWLAPLLIAVLSRALGSLLVFAIGNSTWPLFDSPPALGPATMWDGAWFLEIARFGYHAAPVAQGPAGAFYDFAFWPVWPAILGSALRILPISPDLLAALLANSVSIAAIVLWARVLERAFDRSTARYAVAFMAFSPSAFVLSMGYSEPLFLLIGALFFLRSEGAPARPLLAAVAQATRLTGIALGATALPALWRSRGRDVMAWITLAAPIAVFVAWWIVIAALTGEAGGYLKGSPGWIASTRATSGLFSLLIAFDLGGVWLLPIVISAAFAIAMAAGTVILARQRHWEFACYAAVAVLPSLALASWEWMPRHLIVAVPAFAGLMAVIPARRRQELLLVSIGAEVTYALFVLGGHFAP